MACSEWKAYRARAAGQVIEEADGGFEDAASFADILAEENDVRIALHLLRDAAGDGVAIG